MCRALRFALRVNFINLERQAPGDSDSNAPTTANAARNIAMRLSFLIITTILTAAWIFHYYRDRKKKREAELAILKEIYRQDLLAFCEANFDRIEFANTQFTQFLQHSTGFFSNYQLLHWKQQHKELYEAVKEKSFNSIDLPEHVIKPFVTFLDNFSNADTKRNLFNKAFITEELIQYQAFFDNVEGRKLDIQQRTAIISDEDNNLVIAGAGSGKTTTIVGKVNYILERYKVPAEEILLISFTSKSAGSLAERINIPGVEAKTFHKLGRDIIVATEGKQPSIFDEAQFKPLIKKIFSELSQDQSYLKKVTKYFSDYLKPEKSQFEFSNQGDYIQYLKDQNFQSYKLTKIQFNGKVTYKMEVVKSMEECKIANFLYFNNIRYEYEWPYEHDTASETHRQYKPDFTIIHGDKKIYLEHFGISREGTVPDWFEGDGERSGSQKYLEDMEWKRNIHKQLGTTLIESYSYEMQESILFDNLTGKLKELGIDLKPKSPEQIWEIITKAAEKEVESLVALFGTFITLMKSNHYSINDLIAKNQYVKKYFTRNRNELFFEIIAPILEQYEARLKERNEIDFSDMISRATAYVTNGKYKRKYSYVIIDEFQDISIGRFQLIKAIKGANPFCKMFCVGDDWQSIYRFSGSDIALFRDFEKYFGYSVKSKIETTYRFNEPLIKLSSDFILKNPNQTKKELKGLSTNKRTDYAIYYSTNDNQDDTFALKAIFDELIIQDELIANKSILVVGRYGFDFDRIKNESQVFRIDRNTESITYNAKSKNGVLMSINVPFMTIHKSKGLEADIVIVINCNAGRFGFPSEMSDDPILNLLLSEADQYENGEERRLFYVAMTRARDKVYFVTEISAKSKFINELEVESGKALSKKCPKCRSADIVLRRTGTSKNGHSYKFYGCTNYQFGCDYTHTEWEKKIK